jgi:hypothetical protein
MYTKVHGLWVVDMEGVITDSREQMTSAREYRSQNGTGRLYLLVYDVMFYNRNDRRVSGLQAAVINCEIIVLSRTRVD